MPEVVTDLCIKDFKCTVVCQRKAIHPLENEPEAPLVKQVFINPKRCISCGTCMSVCEQHAIFPLDELPEDKKHFAELNAAFFRSKPKVPTAA
jgi:ferredoxin